MRLLHPRTLEIISQEMTSVEFLNATVSRKQVVSHAWSECLKYLATRQKHPKMFLDDFTLGCYMYAVRYHGMMIGCNLNGKLIEKYPVVLNGYNHVLKDGYYIEDLLMDFDDNYLFSDAVSLYLKGVNIFPYIFGDEWRKYVPIENLKEIHRVVGKTLDKKKK